MADLDISDPAKLYSAEYLSSLADKRTTPAKEVIDELELPTSEKLLIDDTQNMLSQLSPAYGAKRMYGGVSIAPNKTTLMNSPSPQMSMATPYVGKDITVDELRQLISKKESNNNYTTFNKGGYYGGKASRASGAYQYTPSTWNGYGGYAQAAFAPPEVQDRRMNEDLIRRVGKYKGDAFKVIAEHYLPAQANRPELWDTPSYVGKTKVMPVAEYIAHVVKGTPLEQSWRVYSGQEKPGAKQ